MSRPIAHATPREDTQTLWFNPLPVDQRLIVLVGIGNQKVQYVIPAGGEKKIPSIYDRVIHDVHSGVIVGGECPQLVNKSVSPDQHPKLADALNTQRETQRAAELEAATAAIAARAAEDTRIIAQARAQKAKQMTQDVK